MKRPNRKRHQVVIQIMPGPEPWLRIEHDRGWFKLPLFTSLEELWRGTEERWTATSSSKRAPGTIRVPATTFAQWQAEQRLRGR